MNDEAIRKIMAEVVGRSFDRLVLDLFSGNVRTSPDEWISFKPCESMGTYADVAPETEASPDFTWRTEYVSDYALPADSLVIDGEYREVGGMELPAGPQCIIR
jgi:hypothetical protein